MSSKICCRCVMDDSSDKTIRFNEDGVCNYCTEALSKINTTTYFPGAEGERRLQSLIKKLKEDGRNSKYDCLMGISGGLDSSYLAYLGSKWGLRILAIHIDDGFDTDISKKNVKNLMEKAKISMLTINPKADEFNDLTKAFMKAGVPNIAIPQDNVLFAFLYETAKKNNIHAFLSGGNFALESILQEGNTHSYLDLKHIKDIHKKFGTKPINHLLFTSYWKKAWNQLGGGTDYLSPA
jgi:tRNA(Ile)-lysidine synthase TilS/MesJ